MVRLKKAYMIILSGVLSFALPFMLQGFDLRSSVYISLGFGAAFSMVGFDQKRNEKCC